MEITLGSDPEAFFIKSGSVYPAALAFEEYIGNNVVDLPTGSIIVDGVAIEFQPYAATEPEEVVHNLKPLLKFGYEMSKETNVELRVIPEYPFDLKWCESDPSLGEFGCSPDVSAWGDECLPATIDASKHPWRYAGCHIHIGVAGNPGYFNDTAVIERVSKSLDRTVGLTAMVLNRNLDRRRRSIYGRPGIYRHQPWGMEYRTPGNILLNKPTTMKFIFKLTKKVVELSEEHYKTMEAIVPDDILLQTLRGDDLNLAYELYLRMANVFCLDKVPSGGDAWQEAWGFVKSPRKKRISSIDSIFEEHLPQAHGNLGAQLRTARANISASIPFQEMPIPEMPEMEEMRLRESSRPYNVTSIAIEEV